jgi:hypothetical protein
MLADADVRALVAEWSRDVRAQDRPKRQRVIDEKGEQDRDRDERHVAPAECGCDDQAEHLADRAAGEAMRRCLEGRPVQRGLALRAAWSSCVRTSAHRIFAKR